MNAPPRRAERLARWSLAPWERAAVLGDLLEEFRDLQQTAGDRAARRWYWRQTVVSVWPNLVRRLKGDDQRLKAFHQLLRSIAISALCLLSASLPPKRHSVVTTAVASLWLTSGVIGLLAVLLRRRVRPHPLQAKLLVAAYFAGLLWVPIAIATGLGLTSVDVLLAIQLFLMGVIGLWPKWPALPTPTEFNVRRATSGAIDGRLFLTMTVPNEPLALSPLVLSRAPLDLSTVASPRLEDPIIERRFTAKDVVRVSTLVNLESPDASALVELVDRAGTRYWRHTQRLHREELAEQVGSWDDLADRDAAEHFAQVDVCLPFTSVPPGSYRIRVTVDDGRTSRERSEPIQIVARESI